MTKLLFDMNVSPLWLKFFTSNDICGTLWRNVGAVNAPDIEIMEYAKENGFIIFTYDLDFGDLLAKFSFKLPSVIQLRTQSAMPATHGNLILTFLDEHEKEFDNGILVTIMKNKFRIKQLPIIAPNLIS